MAKKSDSYWADRQLEQQDKVTDRTIEETNKALAKYYKIAADSIIREFEVTYNHHLARQKEGEVTPADLHNLDRYWQMLSQVEKEASKLGDKVVSKMTEEFTNQWQEIYENTALPSEDAFSTISKDNAEVMVKKPWLADGKGFSERVYGNVAYLLDTLEEELVSCAITGKSSSELKMKLMERFNISYRQAETLVRTETNHIQTEAARQAYQDAGVKQYMYLGRTKDEDELRCNCKKYDRKIFDMADARTGVNLPPLHPNCKCTIKAVVDEEMIKDFEMKDIKKQEKEKRTCLVCGKQYVPRGGYDVCQACRNNLLKDRDVLNLMAKGYSKQDAVNYVSTWYQHIPDDVYYEDYDKFQSIERASLYEEWRKKHPRAKKLETRGYVSLGGGKWQKKFTEPEPKANGRNATNKYGFYLDSEANYQYILEHNAWMDRKHAYEAKAIIVDENNLFLRCVDCGEVCERKSNNQLRCPECAKEHDKEVKVANAKKNRRKKKKQS